MFFFLLFLLLVVFLLFSLFLNAQEANNTLETKNEYAVVLIFYFSLEDEHVKHRFSVVCATCKKKDRKRNFLRDVFIYKYRHLCCLLKKVMQSRNCNCDSHSSFLLSGAFCVLQTRATHFPHPTLCVVHLLLFLFIVVCWLLFFFLWIFVRMCVSEQISTYKLNREILELKAVTVHFKMMFRFIYSVNAIALNVKTIAMQLQHETRARLHRGWESSASLSHLTSVQRMQCFKKKVNENTLHL